MKSTKTLLSLLLVFLIACTDNENDENTFSLVDFSITIDENPEEGQSLGFMDGNFNASEAVFSMLEENPEGALSLDTVTGELKVAAGGLFNFETNPTLTAVVQLTSSSQIETATVTVALNDLEEAIDASDLNVLVHDMPVVNQNLGTVEATSTVGSITYSIVSQSPEDALVIDPATGEVFSNDDLEFIDSSVANATVKLESNGEMVNVNVAIKLAPICDTDNVPSLRAYYPMNSNAMDESGFGNHGTVSGAVLDNDRFSNADSAYYFDGDDDVITVPDNEQLYLGDEFTISAWIYTESIKSQQVIRKGAHVNGEQSWPYGLSTSATNDFIFSVTSGGTLYQARKTGYNANEWYLMTGILKDQKMYLYVNDQLVGFKETEGSIIDDVLPLLIGTRLSLPSSTFDGIIDEVRIYDSALCESDVIELYNN